MSVQHNPHISDLRNVCDKKNPRTKTPLELGPTTATNENDPGGQGEPRRAGRATGVAIGRNNAMHAMRPDEQPAEQGLPSIEIKETGVSCPA